MTELPSKILVVDNDQGVLKLIESGLKSYSVSVTTAKDWESALYIFNQNKIDIAVIALELPELSGTALIQKWRAHPSESKRTTPFVLMSGIQRSPGDESLIKEIGDVGVVTKPIKIPTFLSTLAQMLKANKERIILYEKEFKVLNPLIDQGKVDKALTVARTEIEPISENGKFISVKAHAKVGQVDQAIEKIKGMINKNSLNMRYHNELGRLLMQKGDLEQARACFEKADLAAPKNIERVNDMAHMYLSLKMPDQSIEKFRQVIALNPEDKEIKFDMYEKIADAGYEEHARAFCKETSTPKELVKHFNNKGVLFSKSEQYRDAIDEYKKAIRFIPGSKELYRILYNMAISHINLKSLEDLQKAHSLLEESLQLQPNFDKAKDKLKITSKYAAKKK